MSHPSHIVSALHHEVHSWPVYTLCTVIHTRAPQLSEPALLVQLFTPFSLDSNTSKVRIVLRVTTLELSPGLTPPALPVYATPGTNLDEFSSSTTVDNSWRVLQWTMLDEYYSGRCLTSTTVDDSWRALQWTILDEFSRGVSRRDFLPTF